MRNNNGNNNGNNNNGNNNNGNNNNGNNNNKYGKQQKYMLFTDNKKSLNLLSVNKLITMWQKLLFQQQQSTTRKKVLPRGTVTKENCVYNCTIIKK